MSVVRACVKNSARERSRGNRKVEGAPPAQRVDVGFPVRAPGPEPGSGTKLGMVI